MFFKNKKYYKIIYLELDKKLYFIIIIYYRIIKIKIFIFYVCYEGMIYFVLEDVSGIYKYIEVELVF